MKRLSLVCAFVCLFGLCIAKPNIPRKQLAGEPSQFDAHKIPSPAVGGYAEDSVLIRVNLKRSTTDVTSASSSVDLVVDSDVFFGFSVFSPGESHLALTLKDPNGHVVDLSSHALKTSYPIGYSSVPGTMYTFEKPKVGTWALSFALNGWVQADIPQVLVLLYNYGDNRVFTHLMTYDLQQGKQIGLVTRMTNKYSSNTTTRAVAPAPAQGVLVSDAVMDVFLPDGSEVEVPMFDDGLHSDGAANDGIWGGHIAADEVGTYRAQAIIRGTDAKGNNFVRSTQHIIPVIPHEVEFTGVAVATRKDNDRLSIQLGVTASAFQSMDPLYRAYAEVWSKSNSGETAICWIESLVDVEVKDGNQFITLELNKNWVWRANAVGANLELRNVYITDATYHIPLDQVATIPVKMTAEAKQVLMPLYPLPTNIPITEEMRKGVRPPRKAVNTTVGAAPTLLLLHGYSASENPWEAHASDFTDAAYFLKKEVSLSNDDFSKLVAEFAEQQGMTRFSIIGHSQGGHVALHTYNYYWTGLDDTDKGRIVQSVGTPWEGCTGAGTAADLTKIFGVGCGNNYDLTLDGSALWLTGIDTENVKDVYFYTTTYELGNLFGDYCNALVNFVLEWPNDGITELDYAKLAGANNMGNKEKFCHTTGMAYEAQYYDSDRNKEMNKQAAR